MGIPDTCVEAIVFSFLSITDYLDEGFHIGIFFEISKQLKQEKAHGVIGKSCGFIPMGDDGWDEGEIHQGGDESREPSHDAAIGMDFDVSPLVGVL